MNNPIGYDDLIKRINFRWLPFIPVVLLIVLTAGIYAPSLTGPFVYDDKMYVVLNPAIRQFGLWPTYFTNPETLAAREMAELAYRPLMTLSFAVDYFFWGLAPFGYHLTNLLWHLVNVLLVYGLFMNLGIKREAALLGAVLFALHPIQTETVSWISRRADVLSQAGILGAFWAFIASREAPAPRRHFLYGLALVAFVAALLSKEMAATLPLLVVAWLVIWRRWRAWASTLPFFLVFALYFVARTAILGRVAMTDYWAGSFTTAMLTMARGVAVYLKLLVFPLNLSLEYPVPAPMSLLDPETLVSLLVLALPIIAAGGWRRERPVVLGFTWFYVTLLPVLNIVPIKVYIAERFLYLPSVGLFMAVSVITIRVAEWMGSRRIRQMLWAGCAAAMFLLAAKTIHRNLDWADPLRLWMTTVRTAPWSAKAHYNLGRVLVDRKNYQQAELSFRRALAIDPRNSESANNLGNIAMMRNNLPLAVSFWRKAVSADPTNAEPLFNLALVAERQGQIQDARHYYQEFLRVAPADLSPWIKRARERLRRLTTPNPPR